MNFIEFGPTKNYTGKTPCDTPMITISRIGHIVLNEKAVKTINLQKGDMILLCQDADNKKKWAIKKTKSGGFTLRNYGNKGKAYLMFCARQITEKILISHNTAKTEKLPIGTFIEGGYWPIELN
jgi:hypothetical protein